ncbi:hypothetical protein EZL74_01755 [Flavobacterium silvisoli]|uniref:Uncharacterized protein n=1 Tax=Flavobacterium silvisoli TaxID=2529433 RepID=A0A4Q9Z6Z4_9FLAO|nr:hypothetical protein [Flavobacterium silvisoli]TBX71256.1 hypothetical protein EZL74_01755 [Flavobacterium silvisoli]
MNNSPYFKQFLKSAAYLFICSGIAFSVNFFVVTNCLSKSELSQWVYSVTTLYSIFFVFSLIIMSVLSFVRKKNLDYVGYTFLIATSLKMTIAYFLFRPILKATTHEVSAEKTNFFIIFISFLAIETLLTIRILNNK